MKHSLGKIESKPSDYKWCDKCGRPIWYENKDCPFCNKELSEYIMNDSAMSKFIEDEFNFWREEGLNDIEIINLKYEV